MSKENPPFPPMPRKKFSYDSLPERPALEPPAPSSEYAQKKIPADYLWSTRDHPLIVAARQGKVIISNPSNNHLL